MITWIDYHDGTYMMRDYGTYVGLLNQPLRKLRYYPGVSLHYIDVETPEHLVIGRDEGLGRGDL